QHPHERNLRASRVRRAYRSDYSKRSDTIDLMSNGRGPHVVTSATITTTKPKARKLLPSYSSAQGLLCSSTRFVSLPTNPAGSLPFANLSLSLVTSLSLCASPSLGLLHPLSLNSRLLQHLTPLSESALSFTDALLLCPR
ncbi:unnamed protein product, partial [Ectocarpus sp. 12 AP-2014]